MNETMSILRTYHRQQSQPDTLVLATVLRVQGSSYRQPGARMLISSNGDIAGSVSGGCLERDLIHRANLAVSSQSSFEVIRYDTTDEGEEFETLPSVSLGCQGIVDISLEVITPGTKHPVLELLRDSVEQGREGRAATIISSQFCNNGDIFTLQSGRLNTAPGNPSLSDSELRMQLIHDLGHLEFTEIKCYDTPKGKIEILLERLRPPKRWIIFGAGHDSVPLAETAQAIGWHVTVVDCRSTYSMPQRFFNNVNKLIRCEPSDILNHIVLTSDTLCVLATHNHYHDRKILELLLRSPVAYIGILGPKKKSLRLLDDFKRIGIELDPIILSKLHSPVGIDSGAESPQEIALSVITEAMAIAKGRSAGFLKDRNGPIHERGLAN